MRYTAGIAGVRLLVLAKVTILLKPIVEPTKNYFSYYCSPNLEKVPDRRDS